MKFEDGMLDIETMGMPPSGALVGLGFCFFDVKTETIGPKFYRAVNLATSVRAGMTMDPSTVMFWLGQPDPARQAIMWSTTALDQTLREFNEFLAQHCRPRDLRMYGNAPTFDLTIMRAAYKLTGIECPWHYTNERDFRTLRAMYPSVVYDPSEKGDGAHQADHDAEFQVRHILKIKRYLTSRRAGVTS